MNIVIAGATGFIGRPLAQSLAEAGHTVTILSRSPGNLKGNPRWRLWDGRTSGDWKKDIESAEAVINLCGANVAEGRWSESRKKTLLTSRLESTLALVSAMAAAQSRPKTFINASAIGYYGDQEDNVLDEASGPGTDFLSQLCSDWECEASKAVPLGVRTVYLRIGLVLAADGGAMAKMLPPFKMFLGGPLGSGKQWVSWITRRDLIAMILFLLTTDIVGPVNATTPNPVTNKVFSKALGAALRRPSWLPVPGFILGILAGEMSAMLLGSQRVMPHRLEGTHYTFKDPEIGPAFEECLRRSA